MRFMCRCDASTCGCELSVVSTFHMNVDVFHVFVYGQSELYSYSHTHQSYQLAYILHFFSLGLLRFISLSWGLLAAPFSPFFHGMFRAVPFNEARRGRHTKGRRLANTHWYSQFGMDDGEQFKTEDNIFHTFGCHYNNDNIVCTYVSIHVNRQLETIRDVFSQ